VLFLHVGVPGAVISVPILILLVGLAIGSIKLSFLYGSIILLTLAIIPAPLIQSSLSSWLALQIIRYFSFKAIYEDRIEVNKPYILVAPPHGVFPFGNIVTMLAFPSVMGFGFKGLASSAALKVPIFRQLLYAIGAIDASKESANKALSKNHTIGISTGGVAEVFETNSPKNEEVILLQDRKGIVKLAFRNGAALVPCYLFGNTQLFSLWSGSGSVRDRLRTLSRKLGTNILVQYNKGLAYCKLCISFKYNYVYCCCYYVGFALIIFWGRFFLPVPYRIPIVGVLAKPIEVEKKENPTDEEINAVHALLLTRMTELFDKHKAQYGWADKKLVIM
jgi:2-acylglycerol O-acyltransferase 2